MIHASTVIFFGTSQFAVPILEALIRSEWRPRVVVTAPDRPAGRGLKAKPSPVKQKAGEYGLEVWEPARFTPAKAKGFNDRLAGSPDKPNEGLSGEPRAPRAGDATKREAFWRRRGSKATEDDGDRDNAEIVNISAWADRMAALAPDLFILAAYGKIIPGALLAIPRAGSLNVHPSLLPLWRGPAPIQHAILNGDPVTGITVMLMDEEIDHGPILAQRPVPIAPDDTSGILEERLSAEGARLLLETLPSWINGTATSRPQEHAKATYTHLLRKEDGLIDWSLPAFVIARRIRAFMPWPGSYTFLGIRRITILEASPVKTTESRLTADQKPGLVFSEEKGLLVVTGAGTFEIAKLQVEGKRAMSGKEFLNGHRAVIGTRLGR